ncbi:MAG TPA: hypothetical protein VMT16_09300 [Thermoanaerobaculia bacterium]|nr:hypothetical protein [Thermoanaerobaculia bacterium]
MNHRAIVPLATLLVALALASPLEAQNLLPNAGFDADVSGWQESIAFISSSWSPIDAAGDPDSGSAAITTTGTVGGQGLLYCVPVTPGAAYGFGAFVRVPSGQLQTGSGSVGGLFFEAPACAGNTVSGVGTFPIAEPLDEWVLTQGEVVAPPTANSMLLTLSVSNDGSGEPFTALFDDVRFCAGGTCALQIGEWLQSSEIPDFVFRVTIEAGDEAHPGVMEPVCLDETLCVSGALPGRVEAQLRIIGPRPNGFLWFQVVRFTPSRIVVHAEQLSTGEVNYYVLEAIGPLDRPTSLEDRFAFLP